MSYLYLKLSLLIFPIGDMTHRIIKGLQANVSSSGIDEASLGLQESYYYKIRAEVHSWIHYIFQLQ